MKKTTSLLFMLLVAASAWSLPFVTTTDPTSSTTKWYYLKTGDKYIYAHSDGIIDIDVTSIAGTTNEYFWCFVTASSNRIAMYNKANGYLYLGMFFSPTPNNYLNCIEEGNGDNFYIYYRDTNNNKFYLNYDETEGFWNNLAKQNSYTVEEYDVPIIVVPGDVTCDGMIDIADINALINMMLGKQPKTEAADITNDGEIDIADINAVINLMLGKVASIGEEVTIGAGTTTNNLYPVSGERVNSDVMSRMIYPSSMLTALKGKTLIRLMFYPQATLPEWGCDIQLSLKEVERDNFMGSLDDSWAAGGTVVATLTNVGGSNYLDFIFDTPFVYHDNNLLVETRVIRTGESHLAFFKGDRASTSCSRIYINGESSSFTSFLPKATFTYEP